MEFVLSAEVSEVKHTSDKLPEIIPEMLYQPFNACLPTVSGDFWNQSLLDALNESNNVNNSILIN